MKALYTSTRYCVVVDDDGDSVCLEPVDGDEDQRFWVDYGDPGLIIDPTDGDLSEAGVLDD
jgi:hypothetical protein